MCSVLGCQGNIWKWNSHTGTWDGFTVFENNFKAYFESLKNHENQTAVSTQALPMLPKDLKIIMDYLDGAEERQALSEAHRLYFKAFLSTASLSGQGMLHE